MSKTTTNSPLLLALAAVLSATAAAAWDPDCTGQVNSQPLWTEPPTLVKTVKNGKLFHVGGDEPPMLVTHLYGSPYEKGFAHGELLKDEINELFTDMYGYLESEVQHYLSKLPKYVQEFIAKYGIKLALSLTYDLTKPYIPDEFTQEIQGLADATNNTLDYMMQLTLFPELIQASCSMMGAWGQAINGTDGSLYQLRALDWDTSTPMQKFPMLTVYHAANDSSNSFVQLGWAGMTGAITGFSNADVGICEKVWLHYKGQQNRAGLPFTFMLRNLLQYSNSFDDAISIIASAKRTCSIFVGVGTIEETGPSFRAVQYSYETVRVLNDHNFANHTQFKDTVYVDKHTQPSHHTCMPSLVDKFYGQLDALTMMQKIAPLVQTGDMHLAAYDFEADAIYVASASPFVNGTATPAYNRQFIRLDTKALFAETQ